MGELAYLHNQSSQKSALNVSLIIANANNNKRSQAVAMMADRSCLTADYLVIEGIVAK